jgi:hypothetical protein
VSKLRSKSQDVSQDHQAMPDSGVESVDQLRGNDAAQDAMTEEQGPERGILNSLGAEAEGLGATAGPPRRRANPKEYDWSVRYTTKPLKGDDGGEDAPSSKIEESVKLNWAMPNEDRTEVDEVFGHHTKTIQEKGGDVETETDNADYMPSFSAHLAKFDAAASAARHGKKRGRRVRKPSRDKAWPQE